MQIDVQMRATEPVAMRPLVQRRVHFVLRRLRWLVTRTTVQLSDVNGPRGGLDKRCQVIVKPVGLAPVVVTAHSRDWRQALDNALARVGRVLLRHWRRHHAHGTGTHRRAA